MIAPACVCLNYHGQAIATYFTRLATSPSPGYMPAAKSCKKIMVLSGVDLMISMQECAEFYGLASEELIFDVAVSGRHATSLASYLLNIHRGAANVRQMIIADLRGFLDLGMRARASDALVVLRMFLLAYPDMRRVPVAA